MYQVTEGSLKIIINKINGLNPYRNISCETQPQKYLLTNWAIFKEKQKMMWNARGGFLLVQRPLTHRALGLRGTERLRVRRSPLDRVSGWWSDQQFVRAVHLSASGQCHPKLLFRTHSWLLLNWKVASSILQYIWLCCLTEGNIIFVPQTASLWSVYAHAN